MIYTKGPKTPSYQRESTSSYLTTVRYRHSMPSLTSLYPIPSRLLMTPALPSMQLPCQKAPLYNTTPFALSIALLAFYRTFGDPILLLQLQGAPTVTTASARPGLLPEAVLLC